MFINEQNANLRRIPIIVYDLDGVPKTGLAYTNAASAHQIQISINGAAPVDAAGAIVESGLGIYYYTMDASEMTLLGFIVIVLAAKTGTSQAAFGSDTITLPDGLHRAPNSILDNATYNTRKFLTGARVRIFASHTALAAATVGHADGVDGEIYRFTYVGVDRGDGVAADFTIGQVLP